MIDGIKQIVSPDVPEPSINIYSNCLRVGNQLFLSGMIAADTDGNVICGDSVYEQAVVCFRRVKALIEAGGGQMNDIVKMTTYLVDMTKRDELIRARRKFCWAVMPCSTLVGVTELALPSILVEIDVSVMLGAGDPMVDS